MTDIKKEVEELLQTEVVGRSSIAIFVDRLSDKGFLFRATKSMFFGSDFVCLTTTLLSAF